MGMLTSISINDFNILSVHFAIDDRTLSSASLIKLMQRDPLTR